ADDHLDRGLAHLGREVGPLAVVPDVGAEVVAGALVEPPVQLRAHEVFELQLELGGGRAGLAALGRLAALAGLALLAALTRLAVLAGLAVLALARVPGLGRRGARLRAVGLAGDAARLALRPPEVRVRVLVPALVERDGLGAAGADHRVALEEHE